MTFKENLNDILKELNRYKRDKEKLKYQYIQSRLDETLERYYENMTKTFLDLSEKDEREVLKRIGE